MSHAGTIHATHPRGNIGALLSASTGAAAAAAGRLEPAVIAWARHALEQAGLPKDHTAQVEALLDAIHREKWFVSDPVDAQMIVAPKCFLGVCNSLPINGAACLSQTASLAAAVESIGIPTAVVAQAFDVVGKIQHVLVTAEVSPGQWVYAEPSEPSVEIGQLASPPTREVWVSTRSGRVLCDRAPSCFSAMQGQSPDTADRPLGDFVGVGVGQASAGSSDDAAGVTWWQGLLLVAVASGVMATVYFLAGMDANG